MNQGKLLTVFLAIFVALAFAPIPKLTAQIVTVTPQITVTQPIYPTWRVGGTADFAASHLTINTTYYVWYARPNDASTKYSTTSFTSTTGSSLFQVSVAPSDPPGTYLVSLSTSPALDTRYAVAHFGVIGTDADNYKRTATMHVVGGGFKPNSTITITLSSAGQAPLNLSVKADIKGNFNSGYRLPPSIPLGQLAVLLTGPASDSGAPVSASTSAIIGAASVTIRRITQPPTTLERTTDASLSVRIAYPDGSPVTTSSQNSTRAFVSDSAGGIAAEVRLVNSNSSSGVWTAIWEPSFSQSLGSFHFTIFPTDFDDSYGNIGQGKALTSNLFQVIAAHTGFSVQGNSTIQRTLAASFTIAPTYHDGKAFANVTQASAIVREANGRKHRLVFNNTLGEFEGGYKTNSSTPLGSLLVTANVTDLFGNTATGSITIQIVPAVLTFRVDAPTTQRTTILNITAQVTYPDGSIIAQGSVRLGFNVTLTKGNFTWSQPMAFSQTTNDWLAGYRVPQNASLGDYAVAMNVTDPYGNAGAFAGKVGVVPATFIIQLPISTLRASPLTMINVGVNVMYPNGSALVPSVGGVVTASFMNSTGTYTVPLDFNATSGTWSLTYKVPDPGLRFGLTMRFSFSAIDQFGNTGSVSQAFELDISAGTETLILATIIGAIVPIGLIGWAFATVSARRRKHKP